MQLLLQKKRSVTKVYSSEKVEKAMQQTLSKTEVSFHSEEQKQKMKTVLAEHTLLIVVLLMKEEKSLLFMTLTCLKESEVTVVVMLFQVLLSNMIKCMKKIDIECIK